MMMVVCQMFQDCYFSVGHCQAVVEDPGSVRVCCCRCDQMVSCHRYSKKMADH